MQENSFKIHRGGPPHWPSGLGVRLGSGGSRARIPVATGFFQVQSYQWLKHWHTSRQDFSRSSHTSDLNIGTPVATLPGTWSYRITAGTSRPGVSILWLGEIESLICHFYLSVAACKTVCADPSLRYTIVCCWDVKQPTKEHHRGASMYPSQKYCSCPVENLKVYCRLSKAGTQA